MRLPEEVPKMLTLLFRPLLWLLKLPLALGKASKPAVGRVLKREGFTYGESYKEDGKTIIPLGYHPQGGEFELIANLELTPEYACLRPLDGWTQSAIAILSALAPEGRRAADPGQGARGEPLHSAARPRAGASRRGSGAALRRGRAAPRRFGGILASGRNARNTAPNALSETKSGGAGVRFSAAASSSFAWRPNRRAAHRCLAQRAAPALRSRFALSRRTNSAIRRIAPILRRYPRIDGVRAKG